MMLLISSRLTFLRYLFQYLITLIASSTQDQRCSLPDFEPSSIPVFNWGSVDSDTFCHSLEASYSEVVHWRNNSFKIPSGNVGKKFVLCGIRNKQTSYSDVLYHMRILYHTRMVHTICVYAYGTTIRVWYGKSYHLSIANLVCV